MSGRLDSVTSGKFQGTLTDTIKTNGDVILDFADVQYVSSAGLRALLIGQKLAKGSGKEMILTNVPKIVLDVIKMTGFITFLTIK